MVDDLVSKTEGSESFSGHTFDSSNNFRFEFGGQWFDGSISLRVTFIPVMDMTAGLENDFRGTFDEEIVRRS